MIRFALFVTLLFLAACKEQELPKYKDLTGIYMTKHADPFWIAVLDDFKYMACKGGTCNHGEYTYVKCKDNRCFTSQNLSLAEGEIIFLEQIYLQDFYQLPVGREYARAIDLHYYGDGADENLSIYMTKTFSFGIVAKDCGGVLCTPGMKDTDMFHFYLVQSFSDIASEEK